MRRKESTGRRGHLCAGEGGFHRAVERSHVRRVGRVPRGARRRLDVEHVSQQLESGLHASAQRGEEQLAVREPAAEGAPCASDSSAPSLAKGR
jgi:hypothetical protein